MSSSEEMWKENPIRKLAEASLEKPGMYLIALRAHLQRGKTALDDILHEVADSLPKPTKIGSSEQV